MAPRTATPRDAYGSSGPALTSHVDIRNIRRSSIRAMDNDMKSTWLPVSTRSAVMPRSLSNGAIAGAVVGSLVGAALILLCLSPFILRAIRERSGRRRGTNVGEPDFLTGPDSGTLPTSEVGTSRRLTIQHHIDDDHIFLPPPPAKEFGGGNGFIGHQLGNGDVVPLAAAQSEPLQALPSDSAPGETGAQGELAGGQTETFTSTTREPGPGASADDLAAAAEASHHHHHFHVPLPHAVKHIAEVIRKQTRSSADTQFDAPTRSATWDQDQYLTPSLSAPVILDSSYGDDPHGAAYSYYHDPDNILSESPTSESPTYGGFTTEPPNSGGPSSGFYNMPSASSPAAIPAVPRTSTTSTSQPLHPGRASPTRLSSPEVKQEPEDESTVSPDTPVARESNLAQVARGRLQELRTEALENERLPPPRQNLRMDTLPISGIAADSPVTSTGVVDIPAPSINPMAIMPASSDAEQTHRVKHELDVISHSPPPQVFTANVIGPSDAVSEASVDDEEDDKEEEDAAHNPHDMDMLDISDYSTPPPFSHSSGPSIESTPNTRISDTFTASPSPRLPHEEADVHNGDSPGHQLSASSPQRFQCDICGREFDLFHKLNHHRRYHERPHECPHKGCGKSFGTKTHLDRHINDKHEKTRKFYCMVPDCPYSRKGGKAFPRKDNWRRHMQNKHQITPDAEPAAEFVDEMMTGV